MNKKYQNKNLLHKRYILQNKSMIQIANECKCSPNTISIWLKKFNIDKRNKQKYSKTAKKLVGINKQLFQAWKCRTGCCLCGYSNCPTALVFHHVNPEEKDQNISINYKKFVQGNDELWNELEKCILVCSNCHREIHYKQKESLWYEPYLDEHLIKKERDL